MRIIGGDLKGRNILPPASFAARPTTDFAKEGLFNILINEFDIEELSVLDLFAGTGSISYEFASRGCNDIISIDMNTNHAKILTQIVSAYNIHCISDIQHTYFDVINRWTKRSQITFTVHQC